MGLSNEEKKFLLRIARASVEGNFSGDFIVPSFFSQSLQEKRGAFVTLHQHGRLRGCIGIIEALYPLQTTVIEMARSAAFKDPRFPPVSASVLPELNFEISVLSPLKDCTRPEEIIVGVHGIIIKKGPYSGLLLPQVAIEQCWDRQTFLEQTCIKAGLPPDTWKEKGIQIRIFSGEVFGEKESAA